MGNVFYNVVLKSILWFVSICFLILVGGLFMKKASKISKENQLKKDLFQACAIFFFLNIGLGIFLILSDLELDVSGETVLYSRYVASGYIFLIAAYLTIIVVAEKHIIKKTRHVISILTLCILGFNVITLIFLPWLVEVTRYVNYCTLGIASGISLFIYLYFIKVTTGELRKIAINTQIGLIIGGSSAILNTKIVISTGFVSPYLSPILYIIGLIFITYVLIKKGGFDVIEMLAKRQMTTLTSDFWDKIDQFNLTEVEKQEFTKDMLALNPYEREKILNEMESTKISLPITILPIAYKYIPEEEIIFNAVQDYLNGNRILESETIMSCIKSRFSKVSININETGIKKHIESLVEKKRIVEGSKLTKDDVLFNPKRKEIYDFIIENPGSYLNKIVNGVKLNHQTVQWHVNILLQFDFIQKTTMDNHEIYSDSNINKDEIHILYLRKKKESKKILDYLKKEQAGSNKTQLASELEMDPKTITKYLNLLEKANFIEKKKYSAKEILYLLK